MGQKHSYPTSAELDAVVLHMYQAGMSYAEAVREFRKQFVLTALREANWNESKHPAPNRPGIGIRRPRSAQSRAVPCAAQTLEGRKNSPVD
jgi:hypothetical protein